MKKLANDILMLNISVCKFIEVLETKYESSVMADKLAYFHDCVVALIEYGSKSDGDTEFTVVKLAEILDALETVNAESNVFDIIDVLRQLGTQTEILVEMLVDSLAGNT